MADSINQVRGILSPDEWEVESNLAAGQSYAKVARELGLSPNALKMRDARWRARVRSALAAGDGG